MHQKRARRHRPTRIATDHTKDAEMQAWFDLVDAKTRSGFVLDATNQGTPRWRRAGGTRYA